MDPSLLNHRQFNKVSPYYFIRSHYDILRELKIEMDASKSGNSGMHSPIPVWKE